MSRTVWVVVVIVAVVAIGGWASRSRTVDFAADEVISKFQVANCEQLKAQKDEPPTIIKKLAISVLHDDEKVRVAFIDKIAAPVLNKMIECGMAP